MVCVCVRAGGPAPGSPGWLLLPLLPPIERASRECVGQEQEGREREGQREQGRI